METIDNRATLFELEEIYKYKDLINIEDKAIIKQIIYDTTKESDNFYTEFLKLVAMEVAHELNKNEFTESKDKLMVKMKAYLQRK